MLLHHVPVLDFQVVVVVLWQGGLELVDARHFCLDDDSKSIAPIVHFLRVWIVGKADEVAPQLLDDGELLRVICIVQRICLVHKVVVHTDATQLIWLSIEQESRVGLSIHNLVYDIGIVPQAIRPLVSVVEFVVLVDFQRHGVEVWVWLSTPQVEVCSSDCRGEGLFLSVARLRLRPMVSSIVNRAYQCRSRRNRCLDVHCGGRGCHG